MSTLLTRSKDTIVATIAAGMQGRVARFLNFAVGSVFLALAEAHAGVALWLQGEILRVLRLTRAATSDGVDLDSWVADYGLSRLAAVAATGPVVFSRFSASPVPILVPVGATVQTGDGSQRFDVYADATNPAFDPVQQGYVMTAGIASVTVPVSAETAGSAGNVAAGQISLLGSSVPGVDAVLNAVGFTNGADAESDAALKVRIPLYFASLSQATEAAIAYAVTSLGLNLQVAFLRRDPAFGLPFVTVVVDDGSGSPPSALVQQAAAAVNAVRAGGVWVPVIGATTVAANVALVITSAPGYDRASVLTAVRSALTLHINGLGLGNPLRYSRLEQVAYDASPGVADVTGLLVNGGTSNIVPSGGQTIKAASVVVS